MSEINYFSKDIVGGKAANLGELSNIDFSNRALVPEDAFAVPFYYYYMHIKASGAKPLIDSICQNEQNLSQKSLSIKLKRLRNLIVEQPLDHHFLNTLNRKVSNNFGTDRVRFRSSTNAEDVKGFNGAGLYKSKTGQIGNKSKSIEKAVKAVWASLWFERAFHERDRFKLNQEELCLGILVHKAFGKEQANGVALTKNIYREDYPGFLISVQVDEESVASPKNGVICDHFITYSPFDFKDKNRGSLVEWISKSNLNKGLPVLTTEEIENLTLALASIKEHYYKILKGDYSKYYELAIDVEFKYSKENRKLYIKQARIL